MASNWLQFENLILQNSAHFDIQKDLFFFHFLEALKQNLLIDSSNVVRVTVRTPGLDEASS